MLQSVNLCHQLHQNFVNLVKFSQAVCKMLR